MSTLTRENGRTVIKVLSNTVVDKYCKEYEDEAEKLKAEKKEKEKTPKKSSK